MANFIGSSEINHFPHFLFGLAEEKTVTLISRNYSVNFQRYIYYPGVHLTWICRHVSRNNSIIQFQYLESNAYSSRLTAQALRAFSGCLRRFANSTSECIFVKVTISGDIIIKPFISSHVNQYYTK